VLLSILQVEEKWGQTPAGDMSPEGKMLPPSSNPHDAKIPLDFICQPGRDDVHGREQHPVPVVELRKRGVMIDIGVVNRTTHFDFAQGRLSRKPREVGAP